MELLKMLSASEILAQIISFLLVLFLLKKFAWKKLLALLDARKEKIASEFKLIDSTKEELAGLKAQYAQRLSLIEEEARKLINAAISEGRAITDEIRKKAYQDAQDIIENARQNIKFELANAKQELKEKIIDLSIGAAENVIQEKLTEEGDRKLVDDFLERIDKL